MATDKEIGARLALARKGARLNSATDAAEALGMKYPTYAGHENGNRGLRKNLEKYAKRFNVTVDWLLTGKGEGPPETGVSVDEVTSIWARIDVARRPHALEVLKTFQNDEFLRSAEDGPLKIRSSDNEPSVTPSERLTVRQRKGRSA